MQLVIREDVSWIHGHSIHPHRQFFDKNYFDHVKVLEKIGGMTLDVETDYLFDNQFNVGPIEGLGEHGHRIMLGAVADIIDDVRPALKKCDWCGKYSPLDTEVCPKHENNQGFTPFGKQKYRFFLATLDTTRKHSYWCYKKHVELNPSASSFAPCRKERFNWEGVVRQHIPDARRVTFERRYGRPPREGGDWVVCFTTNYAYASEPCQRLIIDTNKDLEAIEFEPCAALWPHWSIMT